MRAALRGGTGTVQVAVRAGARRVTESLAPVPVRPSLADSHALAERLALPHLEMAAWAGAVPCARHHARQLLWDLGVKELIEPVELVVSEFVTNAVRVSGGLNIVAGKADSRAVIRLWVSVEQRGVLVLVWDASSARPRRQEPEPDAGSGRGLLLVDMLTAAWGSFELVDEPGKVVWALCQS